MARKVHGTRSLLNLPGHHSTATIIAEIESTVDWPENKGRNGEELTRYTAEPNSTFTITDCSNSVHIELDIDSENSYQNTLYKLDTMIDSMRKLRRGVVIERARYVKRALKIPAEKRFGI